MNSFIQELKKLETIAKKFLKHENFKVPRNAVLVAFPVEKSDFKNFSAINSDKSDAGKRQSTLIGFTTKSLSLYAK